MANKEKRGFGSMDRDKQRKNASKGGKSSHSGFTNMDQDKQRDISRRGGESSSGGGG
jgi:general stress protein YciG